MRIKRALLFLIITCLITMQASLKIRESQSFSVQNLNTGLSYETIQEAINAPETSAGHTIFVKVGIYYENVVVNKAIFLVGENRNNTIIDGLGVGTVVNIVANYVSVSSFTVKNAGGSVDDCGIKLSSVDNCNISKNLLIDNGWQGIMLSHSTNNFAKENDIVDCGRYGIILNAQSNNNTVEKNTVENSITHNIAVQNSSFCHIVENLARNCSTDGIALLNSNNNIVLHNTVTRNMRHGIRLDDPSDNNIIVENIIVNNAEYGLWMWFSNNNKFYHNLLNNTKNALVYPTNNASAQFKSINIWDDGYPSGGNYWSDYREKYPNAAEIDSSGIWDTSYMVEGESNNIDLYPLMEPWTPSENGQIQPTGLAIDPIVFYTLATVAIAVLAVVLFLTLHKKRKTIKTD